MILFLLIGLLSATPAFAQVVCTTMGQYTVCNGPSNQQSITTQMGDSSYTFGDMMGQVLMPFGGTPREAPSPFHVPTPEPPTWVDKPYQPPVSYDPYSTEELAVDEWSTPVWP